MLETPIKKGSGLFIRGAKTRIAVGACSFIGIYALFTFSPISNLFTTDAESLTARFAMLCFMAVFNGFNIRTEHMNLFNGLGNNKLFSKIAFSIFVGTIALCSIAGNLIKVTPLSITQWLVIIGLSFVVIPVDLVRKAINKK